jgi:undecaprenyl pyrophosphate synthase
VYGVRFFWSTPVYWPDFQDQDLLKAIEIYRDQITRLEREKK